MKQVATERPRTHAFLVGVVLVLEAGINDTLMHEGGCHDIHIGRLRIELVWLLLSLVILSANACWFKARHVRCTMVTITE